MKKSITHLVRSIKIILLIVPSLSTYANTYCPQQGGYIRVGMTANEVITACGKPISVEKKRTYLTRNVPIQQYVYNLSEETGGRGNVTYPTAQTATLMFTVTAGKITGITLNGNTTQGTTLCKNGPLRVGLASDAILTACGKPNYLNQSYQEISQGGEAVKKETWKIKTGEYSPNLTLKFTNGVLESIE